jgi:DNA-binding transcriptional LysR family regulator
MLDATRLRVLVAVAKFGSVTAAAQALNYAQPSISHHMARLEAETGAKLMERAGRGVRLTDAGRLLAERAEEILGRLDAAEAELAVHVGLRQDRVRLAAFGPAMATLVAAATATLSADWAAATVSLSQAEPAEALRMLRAGDVDVALIFRCACEDTGTGQPPQDGKDPLTEPDLNARLVIDESVYLITQPDQAGSALSGPADLAAYAGRRWITGCEGCGELLIRCCRTAGFEPDIAASTTDYVAAQALVAAGLGIALLPSLPLRAARHHAIAATELPGASRQVLAVSYGVPPGPTASSRLVEALIEAGARRAP